ncbi:hypothetical protein [Novosphingobium sp. AP12]|uniref:hypothetical protein n=1 Tax=Novosphingobium sp. AP12 TaxID=1144305 RepID=UPI000271F68A|nr:hypothetical protein [Novosphingobium sp. AP12]EJL24273.1 hypothetical protein PMI02_03775 [Novosphingobium sp. AP12]
MGIHFSFSICFNPLMFQPDLFTNDAVVEGDDLGPNIATLPVASAREVAAPALTRAAVLQVNDENLDLPAVLERLARISSRPRYTFMVLNLIARAAGTSNSAGPYIEENGQAVPVRDWLSDALMPMAQRDARRRAVVDQVRADLDRKGLLPPNPQAADQIIAGEVRERLLHSGRTNVSRAVSDLVRAGLLRRHYQGYRVDHCNRGAQREAVYTIIPAVQSALGKTA